MTKHSKINYWVSIFVQYDSVHLKTQAFDTLILLSKKDCCIKSYRFMQQSFSLLGYKDSNLEMLESESSALPFGDSPLYRIDTAYSLHAVTPAASPTGR